jgi:hypothetical protein
MRDRSAACSREACICGLTCVRGQGCPTIPAAGTKWTDERIQGTTSHVCRSCKDRVILTPAPKPDRHTRQKNMRPPHFSGGAAPKTQRLRALFSFHHCAKVINDQTHDGFHCLGVEGADRRSGRPRASAEEQMKLLQMALVLILCMPEFWYQVTPYDIWAADQIAQGALISLLGIMLFLQNKYAAAAAIVFGLGRSACVGIWPESSDSAGSICDMQTGLPLTVGVIAIALWVAGRAASD